MRQDFQFQQLTPDFFVTRPWRRSVQRQPESIGNGKILVVASLASSFFRQPRSPTSRIRPSGKTSIAHVIHLQCLIRKRQKGPVVQSHSVPKFDFAGIIAGQMFLRCTTRKKNDKKHRYWSIVEKKRGSGDRIVQRPRAILATSTTGRKARGKDPIEAFPQGELQPRTVALFPADRAIEAEAAEHIVRVKLSEMELRRPRQWGACWLACHLFRNLDWTGAGLSGCRRAARARAGI